jgi:polyphosphate kinase 2 (PPK2 family)
VPSAPSRLFQRVQRYCGASQQGAACRQEQRTQAVLQSRGDKEELMPYPAELIKFQNHLKRTGRNLIMLFDGKDASGKGSTIRRVSRPAT